MVANEIRKLAESAGKSAKEIRLTVKGIKKVVEEAVNTTDSNRKAFEATQQFSDEANRNLSEIVLSLGAIREMVGEINKVSENQETMSHNVIQNSEELASVYAGDQDRDRGTIPERVGYYDGNSVGGSDIRREC